MSSIPEKSRLGKDIAEKRRTLRQIYGGMMTPRELDRELGRSKGGGTVWAQMVGLEAVMVSPKRRAYDHPSDGESGGWGCKNKKPAFPEN